MMSIMEKKDLVVKEGNSYRAQLKLTPAGLEAAEHVRRRATVAVENASRGLTPERRAVFYEALELIVSNLQNICEYFIANFPKYRL
jgi:DNA-binding MarR family transcriptional regulator